MGSVLFLITDQTSTFSYRGMAWGIVLLLVYRLIVGRDTSGEQPYEYLMKYTTARAILLSPFCLFSPIVAPQSPPPGAAAPPVGQLCGVVRLGGEGAKDTL